MEIYCLTRLLNSGGICEGGDEFRRRNVMKKVLVLALVLAMSAVASATVIDVVAVDVGLSG